MWDFFSDAEAVAIVSNCKDKDTAAEVLVNAVIDKAAEEAGLTGAEMRTLPVGRNRRGLHDDTTVVVLYL